ncbi:MAG TPA: NAD(P)/FAD-dependent oxidoreductase [Caulobacteraceae bacterium]|jgi:monoamine oxidase|nr:NAD(P)/FAD-dependent oxidoreductase [Caulobacteraceae bacterium]
MTDRFDIAIVGAGAAGLGAAERLRDKPLSVIVLEARDRIGGRAHTLAAGGFALDQGCGWLHSAHRNPFVAVAQGLGFEIDKTPAHWMRQAGGLNFTREDQAAFRAALGALEERIEAAVAEGGDVAVSELIAPEDRWAPLLNAFSAYYNGAEFDQVSAADYVAYQDDGTNWRLPRGYGALVSAFGADAPVRLETPVWRVDHGGAVIRLETPRGEVQARAVIVTVPTPLIAEGGLAFAPDLPAVRAAAAGLPLGLADKVFLAVDRPGDLKDDSHLFGSPWRTATGSYHLRPFGRPLIEVYLGGRHADALEREGAGASAAFAIEELAGLLGSNMRGRLTPLTATAWRREAWSRGAYSHALPGHAGARAVLAAPVEDRIFFAGEACSAGFFSTAHGALTSGREAADLAAARLARA